MPCRRTTMSVSLVVSLMSAVPALAQNPAAHLGEPAIPIEQRVPTIAWKDAAAYMNREVFLVGTIVKTNRTKTMCFLNFDKDWKTTPAVVIRGAYVDRFSAPPQDAYLNKTIKARGFISEYEGRPEMMITRPEQIEVLPDGAMPKTAGPPKPARAPQPRTPGQVRIATFNVENLFDEYDDPYRNDDNTDVKPRAAIEAVARTLHAVDADVVALEEVENRGYLEAFNRAYLEDLGYRDVVLIEGNDMRGIDVALLSRLPVGAVTSYRHLQFKTEAGAIEHFHRDVLRVQIRPQSGEPFDVFVVHFKSKGGTTDGATDIRLAETTALRGILDDILKREPAARFVVCGDFNDTIDSTPLKAVVGTGPTALRSFHEEAPPDDRITYNLEPYRSMIDFILFSPAAAAAYVPKSYHIHAGTQKSNGSDHNPVVIDMKLR